MNNHRHHDLNVYEIMADISLAAFGIFILLYILFLVLSFSQEAREAAVEKHINAESVSDLQAQIANISDQNMAIQNEMLNGLKQYNCVDSVSDIDLDIINELFKRINKQKHHIKNRTAKYTALTDYIEANKKNIKTEWNKYVKKLGPAPFFVIIPKGDRILIGDESFSKHEFRGLLQSINIGSGVYMKLRYGEQLEPWLQELIAEEGWLIDTQEFPYDLKELFFS